MILSTVPRYPTAKVCRAIPEYFFSVATPVYFSLISWVIILVLSAVVTQEARLT